MSAFPLPTVTSQRADPAPAEAFRSRLGRLESDYIALWHTTPNDPLELSDAPGRWRQYSNFRAARRLIDDTLKRIERFPSGEAERRAWRSALQERLRQFGQERLGWPEGYRNLLLADEFWEATVEFVRRARRFAPTVSPEELFQALRNVWIMNSVQMLLDLEVETTSSVFAYSMLYPWTDNYLDSPDLGHQSKAAFNRRLGQRLHGLRPAPASRHEREVFDLIAMIEDEFPRESHPEAHSSLRAIHRGQVDSLRQQESGLTRNDLLRLSVRKGGASVLPDAYLVAGRLDPDAERFVFGYGVFLQLLDDLQDVADDLKAGHRTLFTAASASGPLDAMVPRLRRFIDSCLSEQGYFSGPEYAERLDLIRRNCVALLVGAVADRPELYTRRFVRRLQSRWPLRFGALRRLRRRAKSGYRQLGPVLRERFGTDSVLELICRSERPPA